MYGIGQHTHGENVTENLLHLQGAGVEKRKIDQNMGVFLVSMVGKCL